MKANARGVNETGETIVETVDFCGCTNTALEAGRCCGQPQCPNIEPTIEALKARGIDSPLFPDQLELTKTHAELYRDGAGQEVWKIVSRKGELLQEGIASDSDMRTALIEHRKTEGDLYSTVK